MRYWWVNQNQTYRQETVGGYLWSPKRNKNRARNPFYEFMREAAPGDLVFSFARQRILAFGIVRSFAYEAPKPAEFGNAGRNWDDIGWRIDVAYHEVASAPRPADWMERLRPLLPSRYSPLLPDGRGLQSVYLTEIPAPFAFALAEILGSEVAAIARSEPERPGSSAPEAVAEAALHAPSSELVLWEEHLRATIEHDPEIGATEREALVLARRGQGLFRERVRILESQCRITGVDRPEHLRASHCKPWRDCTNDERLDAENGLMLTPSIDHLFDRGFISFENGGRVLISPVAHRPSLARLGVVVDRDVDVGGFTRRQCGFLEYHRDAVFLRAQVKN